MSLPLAHVALLCRYAGISFIAGAVNHGFFSGERSLLTAAAGVLVYLVGGVLDMRALPPAERRWLDLIGVGILSSIGLGLFTGGLTHFPDSPVRSAWVVPLGFAMSLAAFRMMHAGPEVRTRSFAAYAGGMGAVVLAASLATWQLYEQGVLEVAGGHDHASHDHAESASSAPETATLASSAAAVREIRVEMADTMRYAPSAIEVTAGEAVRLVVVNSGRVHHELVIGTPSELAKHAREMKAAKGGAHHHGDGALRVAPGATAVIERTFTDAGELGIACFEPGHYEAGMRGTLTVRPRS